jgi:hypothetical protein
MIRSCFARTVASLTPKKRPTYLDRLLPTILQYAREKVKQEVSTGVVPIGLQLEVKSLNFRFYHREELMVDVQNSASLLFSISHRWLTGVM